MAYICNSCNSVIAGKAYAKQQEVNVGKIGWGWGWSQKGKLRYTSGRKFYRNQIIYYCEDCYGGGEKHHTSVSVAAVLITFMFFAYLVYSTRSSETINSKQGVESSAIGAERNASDPVIEMNLQVEQMTKLRKNENIDTIQNDSSSELNTEKKSTSDNQKFSD